MWIRPTRYILTGIANTATGYGIIFLAMALGVDAYLSNALGFGVGIALSFVLQKLWVFRSDGSGRRESIRFLIACGLAYLANLLILHICLSAAVPPFVAQVAGGIAYSLCGYLLSSRWVFRRVE